jgi:hypothetical protein
LLVVTKNPAEFHAAVNFEESARGPEINALKKDYVPSGERTMKDRTASTLMKVCLGDKGGHFGETAGKVNIVIGRSVFKDVMPVYGQSGHVIPISIRDGGLQNKFKADLFYAALPDEGTGLSQSFKDKKLDHLSCKVISGSDGSK